MCFFGGGVVGGRHPPPKPPVRYAQQKMPTRRRVRDAMGRARFQRRMATRTMLTRSRVDPTDESGRKTLLGG